MVRLPMKEARESAESAYKRNYNEKVVGVPSSENTTTSKDANASYSYRHHGPYNGSGDKLWRDGLAGVLEIWRDSGRSSRRTNRRRG